MRAHTHQNLKRADLWLDTTSTLNPQPYIERMKIMTAHGSAIAREETPHVNQTSRTNTIINADVGEASIDKIDDASEKIEALAEMICRWGAEPAAALFVLMARLQNAADPKALANTAKHLAFTRCGELNVYGMVDAQIASLEGELLAVSSGL